MEAPDSTPPPPENGGAWLFWIIATIVLPSIAGGMIISGSSKAPAVLTLLVLAFIIHLASSLRLRGLQGCAVVALYLGGWTLMVVSFYVGCMTAAITH